MIQKKIFIDVETGGIETPESALLQLAVIVDFNGSTIDSGCWYIRPHPGDAISDGALEVNGITREQIETFKSPHTVLREFLTLLGRHVKKYDKSDKFTICAYNAGLDTNHVEAWMQKGGVGWYGSYFTRYPLDPYKMTAYLVEAGIMDQLPNYKLATVCEYWGIPLPDAHDAMADIQATRSLHYRYVEMMKMVPRSYYGGGDAPKVSR